MVYFKTLTRVRLSETDAKGVVYYAQYFVYFDVARLELFRHLLLRHDVLRKTHQKFAAAEAECKYVESARFDEVLELNVGVSRIGRSSITFLHKVKRVKDGRTIATGRVVDVLLDARSRPAELPEIVKTRLNKYVVAARE
ncbi:MAG: acyl-CoA thioesterase [Thaumarchaeota archaeon]|nr:acyl-CoA thioesterase [Nitrososphaerota archaeon]